MATITRADLPALGSSSSSSSFITDVKHLSSYNWIDAAEPTIAVPGCPPSWTPPKIPPQLSLDAGKVYIDQNAARHPDSPLEPLFRSLFHTNPTFDISSVDVVTDRNNIRKLLDFVNPNLDTYDLNQFRGFGNNFEKAYTSSEIAKSTGHHRIISYSFGGLKFIVRHETDGYVKTLSSPDDHPRQTQDETSLDNSPVSSADAAYAISGSKLHIRHVGKEVPVESTLKIKTRGVKSRLEISEVVPQLWLSQTPKLVRAYHNKGKFQKPQVEDVTIEIQRWQFGHEEDLRRLNGLI
ncbi:unnamed protein product [Clonostachys rosea]|uniref:MACPF domain-containing protein n=1 Tax=Bionectria ochroleuca TaxID=29856 RepID=A0ABY6UB86_BIOOC|nr:unnamed protein product [Clonostachys rosea]